MSDPLTDTTLHIDPANARTDGEPAPVRIAVRGGATRLRVERECAGARRAPGVPKQGIIHKIGGAR